MSSGQGPGWGRVFPGAYGGGELSRSGRELGRGPSPVKPPFLLQEWEKPEGSQGSIPGTGKEQWMCLGSS